MSVNSISSINSLPNLTTGIDKLNENQDSTLNFGDMLNNAINSLNNVQLQSQQMENDFAAGKIDNIQDVMIASEKADLSLQFAIEVRNKLLDSYQEIMRMQI